VAIPRWTHIDVTPKQIPYKRVLFLPDPKRSYEGFQIDNIRVPLRPDPEVHRFIELAELMYHELNKAELKYQHGAVPMSETYFRRMQERASLEVEIMQKYGHFLKEAVLANTGPNERAFLPNRAMDSIREIGSWIRQAPGHLARGSAAATSKRRDGAVVNDFDTEHFG